MKRYWIVFFRSLKLFKIIFVFLLSPSILFALPLKKGVNFRMKVPGEFIVKANSTKGLLNIKRRLGDNYYLVESQNSKKLNAVAQKVYPNYQYFGEYKEFDQTPNDPDFLKQKHHEMIQPLDAWSVSKGSKEIIVAVTDNEFQIMHEDLKNSWWVNENEIPDNNIDDDGNGYIDDVYGWDFIGRDNNTDSEDEYTHGTHVAGIIAAESNNGLGVSGIAPKVKVMPLRWYGEEGSWTSAVVVETYQYAINMGANIISTSYNIDHLVDDQAYLDMVQEIKKNNILLVNSAGNTSTENPPRQNIEDIILVCSVKSEKKSVRDIKSSFSNYGTGIDICAPGDPVYSTTRSYSSNFNTYGRRSGTSMAAPVVAAVAALIWSSHPNFSAEEVKRKLLNSVDNIDSVNPWFVGKLGSGRINAYKAVK